MPQSVLAGASNTRVSNPSAIIFELGGRNLLYSIGYDRVLNENFSAGVGFGTLTTNTNQSTSVIPVYVNYYFMQEAGSAYATAGADLLTNPTEISGSNSNASSLKFTNSPILPHLGLGYEYRSDTGFLFRITAYGFVSSSVTPWGGVTFGYSF
jgi:hypothetical protein